MVTQVKEMGHGYAGVSKVERLSKCGVIGQGR
jgi:hypothetical protein